MSMLVNGIDVAKATKMNRLEYNTLRGWDLPKDEDGSDTGVYLERSNGYHNWMTVDNFNRIYSYGDFSFSIALLLLKDGEKLSRRGWNGVGVFIFLVQGSKFQVNRAPLLGIYPEGTEISYRPHYDMRMSDGKIMPWVAAHVDLHEEDWFVVEDN